MKKYKLPTTGTLTLYCIHKSVHQNDNCLLVLRSFCSTKSPTFGQLQSGVLIFNTESSSTFKNFSHTGLKVYKSYIREIVAYSASQIIGVESTSDILSSQVSQYTVRT